MKVIYRYIIGLILLVALATMAPAKAEAFNDTTQHWARMEIEHLQSREIISGYPDGSFRPEANISRQEYVVLLIKAMNKQKEAEVLQRGTASFNDSDTWAKGYVELANEMNIVQGDGEDNFSPLRPINREEAVAMLVKCLGDISDSQDAAGFLDDAEISGWAYPSVLLATKQGLLHGFPDNTFRPHDNLTRAQVSILLESLLNHLGSEYHIYGTITAIDLPLKKAIVNVAGRQESFELASNLVVWSRDKHEPEPEIALPATACLDLNSTGKLAFILIVNQSEKVPSVTFNCNSLYDDGGTISEKGTLVPLIDDEDNEEALTVNYRNAAASLLATGEAMGVREFTNQTGATGKGQLVAVIDSGIDPGHPDLQSTGPGYQKILDFIDLSDEGKVTLSAIQASNGFLNIGNTQVSVSSIPNSGNLFKYGYFKMDFLPESSGLAAQNMLIVMAASTSTSGFNVAYFDTDNDGQIKDEIGYGLYSRKHQVVTIKGDNDHSFNLVVSEISENQSYIKLGFDGFGHGTEVAGIIAAQGRVKGMAPDAQLLVIKIMDRNGTSSLKKLESALSLAADRGAGVAVVSLGQYSMTEEERNSLARTAELIWKSKGMIICMAAGNSGPGLGTVADSTGINNIISVGAYATPEMWATDYGWQVPNPTLWYFSSAGPAANAGSAPLLLAPGSAVSTYPLWADYPYHRNQGTSIAAPHLAGAAALLLDANEHRLYSNDRTAVYQVLLAGAQRIKDLQAVAQGLGAVNLPRAWKELQLQKGKTALLEAKQYSPGAGLIQGLYTRGVTPASLSLHITNLGNTHTFLALGGFSDWIKPEQYSVQIPAHSERTVDISYNNLNEPGLYSSFLVADDFNSSGLDLALLETVVVPEDMSESKEIEQSGRLEPGALRHYFFKVPAGADKITFKLIIKDGKGRARMDVFSPDGIHETSSYAGIGKDENVLSSSLVYKYPQSGIWEVVVYSSVSLSDYDLKASDYILQTRLEGEGKQSLSPHEDRYFVSTVVPYYVPGDKVELTLFFWTRGSKLPASGLVAIDGHLYEIKNGRVTLPYTPQADTIKLNLAW